MVLQAVNVDIERVAEKAAVPADDTEKMRRRRSGRAVAGVAGGVADHLEVKVLWVRLAFSLLAAAGGAGVLAYGLLWVFVPQAKPSVVAKETTRKERQQARGLLALGFGLAIGFGSLTGSVDGWVAGGIGVTLVGVALVWREADESTRRRARTGMTSLLLGEGGRGAIVRVLSGAALVVTGMTLFMVRGVDLDQLQFALLSVLAALIGVAVLTVPFWLRLVRDLGEERTARIRTEERAEIAAHLHDSVLQTLALIQKQADAPREVLRLARGQERQLRGWLYGPAGYGRPSRDGERGEAVKLAEALSQACGEVEDTFAIQVQQVVVGDCELDERLAGMVFAAREAVVNAAKHAGVSEVSVYAEVEPDQVMIFVRDRGKGFDPKAVPRDRHGLADSIRGRMERNGGELRLRTAPGEGTEVQLHMPRVTAGA
ncbi:PspC domain-containing protein [Actinophytocola xanthii]|uniref:Histidine kinase n=1 Tax=Actinophytocola xanthii TaxID=1912961 RepID=A0A1Q8CDM1_9PSEU|nr:PspC domain-containing protein [Actinophytocola xanthii]OLF12456.1 histidine kinase [Actinophytocola xanthii]